MRVRNFVLNNFPFLEDDFDALTDYELFCKMLGYMKKMSKQFDDFQIKLDKYENYFNNLDVQDEVDNKLNEMLENGQLASIVSEFLALTVVYEYDTVADMKLAENLIDGLSVKTFGYYSYNDGGGAYYKIRNKEENEVPDELFVLSLYDSDLVAELVIKDKTINVQQVGIKNDGIDDYTETLNTILYNENVEVFILNDGNYRLSGQVVIRHDNTTIKGLHLSMITLDENLVGDYTSYIASNGKNNIHVENLKINCTEQNTNRMVISIINGEDAYLNNIEIYNGRQYATRLNSLKNVYVSNMYVHDVRNIDTVTGGVFCMESENVNISNIRAENIGDHAVYIVGHDVLCKDVTIRNVQCKDTGLDNLTNAAGITIYGYTKNVLIDNCYFDGAMEAVNISYHGEWPEVPENVIVTNCIAKNCIGAAFMTNGWENNKLKKIIYKGNIIDGSGSDGISLRNVQDFIISDNYIANCPRFGIQARVDCKNGNIIGNSLHNIAQVISCLYLNNGLISNNYYTQDSDYDINQLGLTVGSECSNVITIGNYLQDCTNFNYRIRGSSNKGLLQPSNDMDNTNTTRSIMFGTTPGSNTNGDYAVGDVIINSNPSAGQPFGWVCVTAGTPGTWKVISTIAS